MSLDNPYVLSRGVVSSTGTLTRANQVQEDGSLNFVNTGSKAAILSIIALNTALARDKPVRFDGEGGYLSGFSEISQAQLDAVETTRMVSTDSIAFEPLWYTRAVPSQAIVNGFVVNPEPATDWTRLTVGDGVPPDSGTPVTYTVVTRANVLLTGATSAAPPASTFSERQDLILEGYHVYEVFQPQNDPTQSANFVFFDGGLVMVVPTGLVPTVQIALDNLTNIDLGFHPQFENLLSHLFQGATNSVDQGTDTVRVPPGFSFPVDSRDNVLTPVNDDNHYIGNDITFTSNNASIRWATFGGSNPLQVNNRLIAVKVNNDTTRLGIGAQIVLLNAALVEFAFITFDDDLRIKVATAPGINATTATLSTSAGEFALGSPLDYWCLFQLFPKSNGIGFELVTVILQDPDGLTPTIFLMENIDIDLSVIFPRALGISRSTTQVGRVDEYKFITHDNYVNHATMTRLIRDHNTDKWDFGYARLFEGLDRDKVTFQTELGLPFGSTVNGGPAVGGNPVDSAEIAPGSNFAFTLLTPSNEGIDRFTFVTIAWHTGTGVPSNNDNRPFVTLITLAEIYDPPMGRTSVIAGAQGRGADNFGLQFTVVGPSTAALVVQIINLNTEPGSGAVPVGSSIERVRFF